MNHAKDTSIGVPNTVSFWYQIITILITGCVLTATVYKSLMTPTPRELPSHVDEILAASYQEAAEPVMVSTGLTISRYRTFDMTRNQFVFEGVLWFEYDPALLSLDTISNFLIDRADIKRLSEPRTVMIEGKLLIRYDVLVNFSAPLDYSLFPVDDHRLSLLLTNNRVTADDIIFQSNSHNFEIPASAENFGWRFLDQRVIPGTIAKTVMVGAHEVTVKQPAVEFVIMYGHTGIRYVLVLLLPMFVLLVIMLSTFSYDSRVYFSSMVGANGAALSGLIGFRFVIEAMSPVVGYFMISDVYFLTFLCTGAFIFLLSIFSRSFNRNMRYTILTFVHMMLNMVFVGIMWHVLRFV